MNVKRAGELLIEKIKKDYKDDVAVVVMMGSHLYNDTHKKSDLDMYYVPKTKRGYELSMVFIIDGIGFDFWPISWNRLEKIANHDERIAAIITEGEILYYGDDNDLLEFNRIKEKALDVTDKEKFISKAKAKLNQTYKNYFYLVQSKNISDARQHAMHIIGGLTEAITLINRTTIKRGRGKLKKEIMNMEIYPKNFNDLYDTVFISNDIDKIKSDYLILINETEHMINEVFSSHGILSFKEEGTGFYEETINFYNKIERACEIGDKYTALFAAVEIKDELHSILGNTNVSLDNFPDIIGAYDPLNLNGFLEVVRKHQIELVKLLEGQGVQIREFASFDDLELYLNNL